MNFQAAAAELQSNAFVAVYTILWERKSSVHTRTGKCLKIHGKLQVNDADVDINGTARSFKWVLTPAQEKKKINNFK